MRDDVKAVMSGLEGLTWDDWRAYHSDSEVQNIAKAALELLKERGGKWAQLDPDTNIWECSQCHGAQMIIDGTPIENGWLYCPRCGARNL